MEKKSTLTKNNEFEKRNKLKIKFMKQDKSLTKTSKKWFLDSYKYEYSYHFRWLGRPIIQYPQDIIAIQEIIWEVKPDLIIETGIAHGGSLILSASILEIIGKGKILGIDVDIRKHNKIAIKAHPLYKRIKMIEGSSVDKTVVNKVYDFAKNKKTVMVFLDSNHTHEHVLKELELYSSLVTKGSYLIVFDTVIGNMPNSFFSEKRWNKMNNPKTALIEFLKKNKRFKIDKTIEDKLLITAAPCGYLKCIK
jgi:cephalosporin hydroxylase